MLSRQCDPVAGEAFRVFLVDDKTTITDARGREIVLEEIPALSWARVRLSGLEDKNEDYPVVMSITGVDLQTRVDEQEPPVYE